MSVCIFLASDYPLPEVAPAQEYPLEINLDDGIIYDGGAGDNFYLLNFGDVQSYTDKKYGVCLEWNYTDGRAEQLLKYIEDALKNIDTVELWKVFLTDYDEHEDSPIIRKREMTAADIKELDNAEIWNSPDKHMPSRPSFYCLKVIK